MGLLIWMEGDTFAGGGGGGGEGGEGVQYPITCHGPSVRLSVFL